MDHTDTVNFLPGAFVAIHEESRIGGREEQVINPVGGVKENGDLAGLKVDGIEDERDACGKAALHHRSLALGLEKVTGLRRDTFFGGSWRGGGRGSVLLRRTPLGFGIKARASAVAPP